MIFVPVTPKGLDTLVPQPPPTPKKHKHTRANVSDSDKNACKGFEPGSLDFNPAETMDQGQSYMVRAKLQRRKPDAPVVKTENGREIREVTVSCKVELVLESSEDGAFDIKAVPAGRTFQRVDVDSFTQWDWHVMPLQSGVLHLLLFVVPAQSEAPADLEKQFEQPPITIVVKSRRVYGFIALVMKYSPLSTPVETAVLAVITGVFTAIVIFHYQRNKTKEDPKSSLVVATPSSTQPPQTPSQSDGPRVTSVDLVPDSASAKTPTAAADIVVGNSSLPHDKNAKSED